MCHKVFMKDFLTPEEISRLRKRHRSERNVRTRDRIKAILLSNKGWTYKTISEALLLDEETISLHVSEYVEKQKLTIQTGGSESKLDEAQRQELIAHLEGHTYAKAQEICAYIKEKYDVDYTVAGITSWLKFNSFAYKYLKGIPAKADPEQQVAFIEQYKELMDKTPEDEPILFGDGVHPTMQTKITRGWVRTGKDKLIETTASRTRMNLMGSLDLETMKVTIGSYETIDSKAMEDHFAKIKENYPKARKIHIILDQGPYNRSQETKAAAERYGIVLHYLPPYSPNLNPIERLWKVMNEHARNNVYFKSAKEFREAIWHFFDHTWPKISMSMVDRINDNFRPVKSRVSV